VLVEVGVFQPEAIRRLVAQPEVRDWCVASGIEPEDVVQWMPMRRDGEEVTWVELLSPNLPPVGERFRLRLLGNASVPSAIERFRPRRGFVRSWPPRGTWPELVVEAVRKAGQLEPPSDAA
jgi:hypothetical protein